jgi:hypothetical protein
MSDTAGRKKRKNPCKAQASRLISLNECQIISSELLLGKSNKDKALRQRDHCLFWFLTMTGLVT